MSRDRLRPPIGALSLVAGPALEPVSLQQVKDHLRITHAVEDALIEELAVAARQHIDGRNGWLGRALVAQTWDWVLPRFPDRRGMLRVPLPPLQSVTSITYLDGAQASQTLTEGTDYLVDSNSEPGRIEPAIGSNWPSTADRHDAVTMRFVAGWGGPEAVPLPIKQALLLLIGHWYRNREPVVVGTIVRPLPIAIEAQLMPFRRSTF